MQTVKFLFSFGARFWLSDLDRPRARYLDRLVYMHVYLAKLITWALHLDQLQSFSLPYWTVSRTVLASRLIYRSFACWQSLGCHCIYQSGRRGWLNYYLQPDASTTLSTPFPASNVHQYCWIRPFHQNQISVPVLFITLKLFAQKLFGFDLLILVILRQQFF